jgi:thiosulfate/3-mercaptopyruvate sulfurtransferase
VEKWKKVAIVGTDGQTFLASIHGKQSCVSCHGGQGEAASMEEAHVGVVSNPSEDSQRYCGGCHGDLVGKHLTSLHKTQQGYFTFFSLRYNGTPDGPIPSEFDEEFEKECGTCHASCGQCHVSVPVTARGGLVKAHNFYQTPDMTKNCTACHGSRIGDEFLGNNEGYKADAHWIPAFKRCEFCHSGHQMHGDGNDYAYKLQTRSMPACEDCHEQGTENEYHSAHWGQLSCSICHSQPYRNCNGCHVGGAGITGTPYFVLKIGKNSNPEDRLYEWVTLRHIPISRDTYAAWGFSDLPYYDIRPTWKYTMPHNMQKNTTQTEPDSSAILPCAGNCHNNESIFLRPADLVQEEIQANDAVVVKDEDWPVGP